MLLGYRTPGLIAERLVQRAQLRSSFINTKMFAVEKPVSREKIRMTSSVRATVT